MCRNSARETVKWHLWLLMHVFCSITRSIMGLQPVINNKLWSNRSQILATILNTAWRPAWWASFTLCTSSAHVGTHCNKTISGKSSIQYQLLFRFGVSKRPLIMKHFCFWRQNEACFLNTEWCIGGRNTFLKQMYGISYLFSLASSSGLVGVQRSLILVPNFFCFLRSLLPLSSFAMHCSRSLLATIADRPPVNPECAQRKLQLQSGQRSLNPQPDIMQSIAVDSDSQ